MIPEIKLKCQRLLPIKMHILEGKGEDKQYLSENTHNYNKLQSPGALKDFFSALSLPSTY